MRSAITELRHSTRWPLWHMCRLQSIAHSVGKDAPLPAPPHPAWPAPSYAGYVALRGVAEFPAQGSGTGPGGLPLDTIRQVRAVGRIRGYVTPYECLTSALRVAFTVAVAVGARISWFLAEAGTHATGWRTRCCWWWWGVLGVMTSWWWQWRFGDVIQLVLVLVLCVANAVRVAGIARLMWLQANS